MLESWNSPVLAIYNTKNELNVGTIAKLVVKSRTPTHYKIIEGDVWGGEYTRKSFID